MWSGLDHNLGVQPLGLANGSQAPHREVSMAVRSEPCS